jgi:hypothetical protein
LRRNIVDKLLDKKQLEQALGLLGGLLEREPEAGHLDIVICGGSALIATGLVNRTTRDVDVLALLRDARELGPLGSLPPSLSAVAAQVAQVLGLSADWLNTGPQSLVKPSLDDQGLPPGLVSRLIARQYGSRLTVHFVSREDQVYLKIPAAADQGGPSRHLQDLLTLKPTAEELEAACRWAIAVVDSSPAFVETVRRMITSMGYADVASRI